MAANTTTLKTSSSVQLVANQKRRPPKESFCEFDIVENYHKSKQNRRKKGIPKDTSELTKKINAFAARNAEIEEMYRNKHASDSSSMNNNLQSKQISSGDGNLNEKNKLVDEYKTRQRRTASCEPQHTRRSRNVREGRRESRISSNTTSDEKETSAECQICRGRNYKDKNICQYCSGQVRYSKRRHRHSNDTNSNKETKSEEVSELMRKKIITVYENVNATDLSESVISKDFREYGLNANDKVSRSRQDYSGYIQNSIKLTHKDEEIRKHADNSENIDKQSNKRENYCAYFQNYSKTGQNDCLNTTRNEKSDIRKEKGKSTRRNSKYNENEVEHTRSDKKTREEFKEYLHSITKSCKSEKVKKDVENNRKHSLFGKRGRKKSNERMITSDYNQSTPRKKITDVDKGYLCKNVDNIPPEKNSNNASLATKEKNQNQTLVLNATNDHVIIKKEQFEDKDIMCDNEINKTNNTSNTSISNNKKKTKCSRNASPKKNINNVSSNHSLAIPKINKEHSKTQEGQKTKNIIELTADDSLKKLLEIYKREQEKFPKGIYNRKEFRTTINVVRSPKEEINQSKKKTNKGKINRKELSFSNLNLSPVRGLYSNFEDRKPATTQTSKLNTSDLSLREIFNKSTQNKIPELNQSMGKYSNNSSEFDMNKSVSQTTLALRDIYKVAELEKVNTNKKKHGKRQFDKRSTFSDIVTKQEFKSKQKTKNIAQNNKFHTSKTVMPNERIVEISSKVLKDDKISFTVEGVEPAKRFEEEESNVHKISKFSNLKKQTFPGIDINLSDVRLLNHGAKIYSKDSLDVTSSKTFPPLENVPLEPKDISNSLSSPRGKRPFNLFCIKKDPSKKKVIGLRKSEKKLEIFHNKSFFVQHNLQRYAIVDSTTQTTAKDKTDTDSGKNIERKRSCSLARLENQVVFQNENNFEDKHKTLKDVATETQVDLEKNILSGKYDTQDVMIINQCITGETFGINISSKPSKEVIRKSHSPYGGSKGKRTVEKHKSPEKLCNDDLKYNENIQNRFVPDKFQSVDLKQKKIIGPIKPCSNISSKTDIQMESSRNCTEIFRNQYNYLPEDSFHSDATNSKNMFQNLYSSRKMVYDNERNSKIKSARKRRSKSLCSDAQIYQQTSRESLMSANQSFCSDTPSSKKTFVPRSTPRSSKIPIQIRKEQRSRSMCRDARLFRVNYVVKSEQKPFEETPKTNSKSEDCILTKRDVNSKINKSKSLMSINKSSYQSLFEVSNCVLEANLSSNRGEKNVLRPNTVGNLKRENTVSVRSKRTVSEQDKEYIMKRDGGNSKRNQSDVYKHTDCNSSTLKHVQNTERSNRDKLSSPKSSRRGFSKCSTIVGRHSDKLSSPKRGFDNYNTNTVESRNRNNSLSRRRRGIEKYNNETVERQDSDYSEYRLDNYSNKSIERRGHRQKQGNDQKIVESRGSGIISNPRHGIDNYYNTTVERQDSEEMINCHRKEIQALEKCLNDILQKLSKDDKTECENCTTSKMQDKHNNHFELSPKNSKEKLISGKSALNSRRKYPDGLNPFDKGEIMNEFSNHNFQSIHYLDKNHQNNFDNAKETATNIDSLLKGGKTSGNTKRQKMYKFRRNESESNSNKTQQLIVDSSKIDLCRYKKSWTSMNRKCRDPFLCRRNTSKLRNDLFTIESFYKNNKGFMSSSTNLSSQISQVSSSSYPKSTPSLHLGLSAKQNAAYNESTDSMKAIRELLAAQELSKNMLNLSSNEFFLTKPLRSSNEMFRMSKENVTTRAFEENQMKTGKYKSNFANMKRQRSSKENLMMAIGRSRKNMGFKRRPILITRSPRDNLIINRISNNRILKSKEKLNDNLTSREKLKIMLRRRSKRKLMVMENKSTHKKVIMKPRKKQPLDDIKTILKVRNLSISHITESLSNVAILSVSSCTVHKPSLGLMQKRRETDVKDFDLGMNCHTETVSNWGRGIEDYGYVPDKEKIANSESMRVDSDSYENVSIFPNSKEIDYFEKKIQDSNLDLPRDSGMISKEPFYIKKLGNVSKVASADSLDTVGYNVDLCPLTAIFNFSPPSYAYHVYNAITIPQKKHGGISNNAVDETREVQTTSMGTNIYDLVDQLLQPDDGNLTNNNDGDIAPIQIISDDTDVQTMNFPIHSTNVIYETAGTSNLRNNELIEEYDRASTNNVACGSSNANNVETRVPTLQQTSENSSTNIIQRQCRHQETCGANETPIILTRDNTTSNNQPTVLRNWIDNSTGNSERKREGNIYETSTTQTATASNAANISAYRIFTNNEMQESQTEQRTWENNLTDNITALEIKTTETPSMWKNNTVENNPIQRRTWKDETPKILTTWANNASRSKISASYNKYRDHFMFDKLKPKYTKSPVLISSRFTHMEKFEKKTELCNLADASKLKCNNIKFNYITKTNTPIISKQQLGPIKQIEMSQFLSDTPSGCNLSTSSSTIRDIVVSNESGYESSKPNRTNSIKNFFKKGGSLLDLFKNTKNKKSRLRKDKSSESSIPLKIIEENTSTTSFSSVETSASKTVLWFNFGRKKNQKSSTISPICKKTCQKKKTAPDELLCKGTSTCRLFKKCPCMSDVDRQKLECKKYAEKVLMEAALRKEGYRKQYTDFKEIPLDVLMGKAMQKTPRRRRCAECTPIGVQTKDLTPVSSIKNIIAEENILDEEEEEKILIDFDDLEAPLLVKLKSDSVKDENLMEFSNISQGSLQERKLTDKEVFDRLLDNFERKSDIAERLSKDEDFLKPIDSQENPYIELNERTSTIVKEGSVVKLIDPRYKGPRFTDKTTPINADVDCTVNAEDIGTCFARGFRPDNMMLSGDACFNLNKQDKIKMSPEMLKNTESIIDFSERETPLDFLLALGFMVDEASNALKDDDIRSRLLAAITEARVWINKITTTQGTLLYLVAYKARPETMRYFLQLVEAIINKRISNAIKLDGFLRVLEQVEDGRLQMVTILGEDKFEDEENEEKIVKKQLKHLFINVYSIAEKEASQLKKELTSQQVALLRILVAKYRAGLHPHLELIARYIGQGLLDSEVQLEAAMIFLSRLDTADVKLKEFENYCGIRCEKK